MAALAHAHVRPLLARQCREVREAAARVARSANGGAIDREAIHDYRVALRRLRTLLAAAAPLFKRRPLAAVRGALRELAREAGAVRDEEVLAETLGDLELPPAPTAHVGAWLEGRARRERALRAAVVAGLSPSPGDAGAPGLAELLELAEALPLRRRAPGISTRSLALDALRNAGRRVRREAERSDADSPEARHRLRIRWKRVRYTAELFTGALENERRTADSLPRLIKVATRMQKRLGELHDLDEALARIAAARGLSPADRMVVRHGLRTARAELSARLEKELPAALELLPADA